jgi:hypothetical protein
MVGGGVLMRGREGVVLHHLGTVKEDISKLCFACICSLLLYYLHGRHNGHFGRSRSYFTVYLSKTRSNLLPFAVAGPCAVLCIRMH